MSSTADHAIPRRGELDSVVLSVAIAAVGTFLVWLLADIGSVTGALYRNPDNASSFVLAELLDDRGSGDVILGNYAWLEPLYALHLTRWLPDHRQLWEAGPFVLYVASVALIGWQVGRGVSRQAGLVVALAMAAPAPLVLGYVAVPNAHGHTLFHVALLGAFAVSVPSVAGWGGAKRALWAVGLAVTLAPGASSDVLLLIGGVLPFLMALAYGWLRAAVPGRVAALGAAACLGGVGGGYALAAWADDARVHETGVPIPLASTSHALANVWRLLEDSALFIHGRLGETSSALGWALELVGLVAVVGLPILWIATLFRVSAGLRRRDRPATSLLAVYWAMASLAISAAFILSSAPEDIGSTRYVTVLWPALLALAAVAFGRRALTPLAVAAAAAAILGCLELADGRYTQVAPYPDRALASLRQFVAVNHLEHGYASYVNAPVITVQTDFAVRTYPVERCDATGDGLCRYGLHRIDSWYTPKRDARSFFVVAERPGWPLLGGPPPRWGPPIDEAQFGPFRVYAYAFDLARILASGRAPVSRAQR